MTAAEVRRKEGECLEMGLICRRSGRLVVNAAGAVEFPEYASGAAGRVFECAVCA